MEVTDLKFKKSKMLLGTMCALVLATTIGAFPSKAESAFDYNYYFWKYPDVANAVGFDPQALFNHYQTNGRRTLCKSAGRVACRCRTR